MTYLPNTLVGVSRGNPFDPVCTNTTTIKISRPIMLKTTSVPFDPVARQTTGTQTSIPDLPPTG